MRAASVRLPCTRVERLDQRVPLRRAAAIVEGRAGGAGGGPSGGRHRGDAAPELALDVGAADGRAVGEHHQPLDEVLQLRGRCPAMARAWRRSTASASMEQRPACRWPPPNAEQECAARARATSSGRAAQRRHHDGHDVEAVVEVLAERRRARPSRRGPGASRRRSARRPSRSACRRAARTSRSCRRRSSFTCIGRGMSPISSRKSVPPSASSMRPGLRQAAPVKAPFSWPNSSLSSSASGSAAQWTATNGPARRGAASWMRSRGELLARAALAAEQHGGGAARRAREQLEHLAHRRRGARERRRRHRRRRRALLRVPRPSAGPCARRRGSARGRTA